jgi:hypothetical protein
MIALMMLRGLMLSWVGVEVMVSLEEMEIMLSVSRMAMITPLVKRGMISYLEVAEVTSLVVALGMILSVVK